MTIPPQMTQNDVLRAKLEVLRDEHRDLDLAISALNDRSSDQLSVRRLKKNKLLLKDRITKLENQLTPDIIA